MDENWGYFGYYFRKPPSVFFSKGSAFSLAVGFAVQQTSVVPGCLHSTPVGQTFCEMPRGTMCWEPKGHVATGETLTCQDLYRVVWGKKGEGAHPFRYYGKVVITLHVIAIVIAIVSGGGPSPYFRGESIVELESTWGNSKNLWPAAQPSISAC